ncbi:MAG: 3-isopropylmalate dehydratase large subunit [Promethearchaeota archaeon]
MSTIVEKILANHSKNEKVEAGEIIEVDIDLVMLTEQLGRRIYREWAKLTNVVDEVWDKTKIISVLDHWVPAPHIDAAEIHKICREWVKTYDILNNLDMFEGICHQVMVEKFVKPGMVVVGSDSHTVTYGALNAFSTGLGATDIAISMATGRNWFRIPETIKIILKGTIPPLIYGKDIILKLVADLTADGAIYKAMEFTGPVINDLSLDSRLTISNMSVEAGAKCGIFSPDERLIEFISRTSQNSTETLNFTIADLNAQYESKIELDVSKLNPQVAKPHSPQNSVDISEVEGTSINQGFIGSCTNGRMEDFRIAATILKGKHTHPDTRLIITPASRNIYLQCLNEGLIKIFIESGAMVTNPTCGACIGGHLGVLTANEVCISTSNRNFRARMGHPDSKIYLANAATVAASVLEGIITDPRKFME